MIVDFRYYPTGAVSFWMVGFDLGLHHFRKLYVHEDEWCFEYIFCMEISGTSARGQGSCLYVRIKQMTKILEFTGLDYEGHRPRD